MNMIERVARAMVTAHDAETNVDAAWRYMVPSARAAIEAMREPTDHATQSGMLAHSLAAGLGENWQTQIEDIYRAMIDAALKEE